MFMSREEGTQKMGIMKSIYPALRQENNTKDAVRTSPHPTVLNKLIATRCQGGLVINLHEQAWDIADQLIFKMRGGQQDELFTE